MQLALDTLSWISLLAGGAFVLIGGLGLLRLPDFFTRLHAAGLTDTLGMGLVIFGLMLQSGWAPATIKLVMIFVFMFITSPTATHALARAALHGKVTPLLTKEPEPGGRDTDQ